jgi:hypothetical protein
MSKDPELSHMEMVWLVSLDALLVQSSPHAHAATAARIVDLWDEGGVVFQRELIRRADAWRQRQAHMTMVVTDHMGPCQRLLQLLDLPNGSYSKNQQSTPKPKPKGPNRSVVRPSCRNTHRRQMTDDEVKRFMELIDAQGIEAVFDPGNLINTDDELFRPPLIVLDRVGVHHDAIAPLYERGEVKRTWDPKQREPAIALAFDLALLVMLREKKWTWMICDRHFSRLPWGHPCKMTPEGRPGWKLITAILEDAGLIELRGGQTWKLTKAGKAAAEQVRKAWRPVQD